ncbi:MAG TPA: hypothetical protein VNT51_06365 [Miltoncostaeaceae bacterium]|nr:hypothetical protein [Miltoncostaeaceae bacterium]
MTREELVALLEARDPLRAARAAALPPPVAVTVHRGAPPQEWLADEDGEGDVAAHRRAHETGRPSEAIVRYGEGVTAAHTADRLLALRALSERTGLLRAVTLVPGEGGDRRPGSWGVEDLTAVAVARLALPAVPAIRVDWRRVGPAAAQVALAFGATDWRVPDDDGTDLAHLAAAVGCAVVER